MKISNLGIELIKHYESLHDGDLKKINLQPKQCPAGIWTVGYGHALKDINGKWLKGIEGFKRMLELYPDLETITIEEADQLLEGDLEIFESKINLLNLNLEQCQFDALVSFTFNCGFNALQSSTLLKRIKGEQGSIEEAFMMWNKADGKILTGLTNRRRTEAILYETGKLKF